MWGVGRYKAKLWDLVILFKMNFNTNTDLSHNVVTESILDSVIVQIKDNSIFLVCICILLVLILSTILYRHIRSGRGLLLMSREFHQMQHRLAALHHDQSPNQPHQGAEQ